MDNAKEPVRREQLTSAEFENLLRRLDADRDSAAKKYEGLRRKLIKFFEWNGCLSAEDLADETFDRVTEKLGNQGIHDVVAFSWGVAKNVRQEASKRDRRIIRIPDLPAGERVFSHLKGAENAIHEKIENQRRSKYLYLCLQRLQARERTLFLAYHQAAKEVTNCRQELAKRAGLTLGALRVRINRLRDGLEKCVQKQVASRRTRPWMERPGRNIQ